MIHVKNKHNNANATNNAIQMQYKGLFSVVYSYHGSWKKYDSDIKYLIVVHVYDKVFTCRITKQGKT